MPRRASPTLTDAERRIMHVFWERGEANVRDVTKALEAEHGLAYTTVLTTVKIMSKKGYLTFRKVGRAHVYKPAITKSGERSRALGGVLSSLFGGSPKDLVMHLVEDEKLSLEDVEALREALLNKGDEGEER